MEDLLNQALDELLTRSNLWKYKIHFGHKVNIWNPKMEEYIYGTKNDIHILNLEKTIIQLKIVGEYVYQLAKEDKKILFVGTKLQAKLMIKAVAEETNNLYVNNRWLGGTLTNMKTLKKRIQRLWEIEKQIKTGKIEQICVTKKERLKVEKERLRLDKFFCGIRTMRELPDAIILVNPDLEEKTVREANRLNIPIIAICDTNNNPDGIDYVIPANDDSAQSIFFILNYLQVIISFAQGKGIKYSEYIEPPKEKFKKNHKRRGYGRQSNYTYHSSEPSFRPSSYSSNTSNFVPIVPLKANKKEYTKKKLEKYASVVTPINYDCRVVLTEAQRDRYFISNEDKRLAQVKEIKDEYNIDIPSSEKQTINIPQEKITPPTIIKPTQYQNDSDLNIELINNNVMESLVKKTVPQLKNIVEKINLTLPKGKLLKSDVVNALNDALEIKNEIIVQKE